MRDWGEMLPFIVVGGIVLVAIWTMRPPAPIVVGGSTTPAPDEGARLALAEKALELAVQRDIARMQVEAELKGREYELRAREQEAELERRRLEAEREVAQSQVQASFWGTFWSGLFGLGAAILAGLSDEALYQRAIPPHIPHSGQLSLLARRTYGD